MMNVGTVPGLLSLPAEVLIIIGDYLSPRELLAVSGLCRYLRYVFNVDSLWRRYTHDGRISRGLDGIVSLVEPKFEIPNITSLEPLCEHRLHFLKQNRLLNNVRQGRFVEHRIELPNYVSEVELVRHKRNITYGSKYLFTNPDDYLEVIMIFNIENLPTLLMTINLEKLTTRGSPNTVMSVMDDKLVVQRNVRFDCYDLKLPESVEKLYTIHEPNFRPHVFTRRVLVIGKFLFVEPVTSDMVHMWDMSDGNQCSELYPKIRGPNFRIIGYSQNEQFVVMSVGMHCREPSNPHLFVYDSSLRAFSSFNPVLNNIACRNCQGLFDGNYVVLLKEMFCDERRRDHKYSITVFDYKDSTLVVEKSNIPKRESLYNAVILDGYLALKSCSCNGVRVMDLKSLQIIWEIQVDMPERQWKVVEMEVLHTSPLTSLILLHRKNGVEIWDFNTRRKILDLPKGDIALNDTCSKLISPYVDLRVFSFW